MSTPFRYYQTEADNAIREELLINDKCLVKMFCGTGKSLLMRYCAFVQNQNLLVYVFPTLSLLDQFCNDYFEPHCCPFKISSDDGATTDDTSIQRKLQKPGNKIICVTYQSYQTLLNNLGTTKINACVYDEAHHAVAETYQELIFANGPNTCEKQLFFTATPKNDNGIIMYNWDTITPDMCGKLVYDYSYLRGLNDNYLNPFQIRVDMYTNNTNTSMFESIARTILVSGNNRVLTFHTDVHTDRDTSVANFVNESEFITAFQKVLEEEFPEKVGVYTHIHMIALDASIKPSARKILLKQFDETPNHEIYIISSCETIGEGIDTKNANMCVFVDPKSSPIKIIQNIGRIVRKQSKISTILIPCWVDRDKYVSCEGDRDKCDEVIRTDLNKDGNFNGILNVLSALKQEDEELYDICLHYPDTFSPQEINANINKHGYRMLEPIGDGTPLETMEYLLDEEIDYEMYDDCDTDEEIMQRIAEDYELCVEIHTNSLENQIETYNNDTSYTTNNDKIIRLCRQEDEEGNIMYCPIVKNDGQKQSSGKIGSLQRKDKIQVDVHTNSEVKVLWNIVGDFDVSREICSCIIDCEVETYDPMDRAVEIVERANERMSNGLRLLPRHILDNKRTTPELEQEHKDARKLGMWKQALKGKGSYNCSDEVRDYLDEHLPGWRDELDEKALEDAQGIVLRQNQRPNLLPRKITNKNKRTTPELIQEEKDSRKLGMWKQALKGNHGRCSDRVRDYLDQELPGWRDEINLDEKAFEDAQEIVSRKHQRPNLLPRGIHKHKRTTPELEQEHKDAVKLGNWKIALKETHGLCSDKVRYYLDDNLPGWRTDLNQKALEYAQKIVSRQPQWRNKLLPKIIENIKNRTTPELEQEHKDATKLQHWKRALNGSKNSRCSDEVRDYLDLHLPGWRGNSATDETNSTLEEDKEEEFEINIPVKKKSTKLTTKPKSSKEKDKTDKRHRTKSNMSVLHQRYKSMNSANLHQEFHDNPTSWHNYHAISETNWQSFPEDQIPRSRIIEKLNSNKTKRTKLVVDMGCGKADISEHFKADTRFQFINYDHIACNETVEVCDISSVPLEDNSVEICILSMAMWGHNCREYITEAYRILETNGTLYIIEPTKRWTPKDADNNIIDGAEGTDLIVELEKNNFRIVEQSIEKFCMFVSIKV